MILSRDCRDRCRESVQSADVDGTIRIGELARRSGTSPELLRAWEQRYGLLRPSRSAGGFRLYSAADEARIQRMTRLIADGLSAAEAARQALATVDAPPVASPPVVGALADELRAALDEFDGAGAHAAVDQLLATVSVEFVVTDVLLPYLRELGDRWAAGTASVAQEHFASNLIRGRLIALARDLDSGSGPSLLAACLPGEAHDIGLLAFGVLTARRGWRVTFLGADTPTESLRMTVATIRPSLTVLVTTQTDLLANAADDIRALAAATPTAVAGIPDERLVDGVGAMTLPDNIVEAARTCQGLLTK